MSKTIDMIDSLLWEYRNAVVAHYESDYPNIIPAKEKVEEIELKIRNYIDQKINLAKAIKESEEV